MLRVVCINIVRPRGFNGSGLFAPRWSVAVPGIRSEFETGGDVDRLVERFVAAVGRLAAGPRRAARDRASIAVRGEMVGDRPIPTFPFVAETDASEMQIA